MRRFCLLTSVFCLLFVVGVPVPARADLTGFVGVNPTPVNRGVKGFAIGAGMLIVGFEAEYCDTSEDVVLAGPRLRTFMFNGLLQTPIPIAGFQFYGTIGGGGYRESLSTQPNLDVTSFGSNVGGGAKINLVGPLRLRLDYRVFNLHGTPRHNPVQRFYAGINLKF
jgi:opacity protein-like surface antigen